MYAQLTASYKDVSAIFRQTRCIFRPLDFSTFERALLAVDYMLK